MIGDVEPVQVSAREPGGWALVESCSGWSALSASLTLHDVGTWSITLPLGHSAIPVLAQEWSGIDIRRPGAARPLVSGWCRSRRLSITVDDDGTEQASVTYGGPTDELVLAGRVTYATPTVDVSTSALTAIYPEADTRTGKPAAILRDLILAATGAPALARRRLSWLTVDATPAALAAGASMTWTAPRGRSLLDIAADLWQASGGAFVLQVTGDDEDGLVVHIDAPTAQDDVAWPVQELTVTREDSVTDEVIAEGKSSGGAPRWVRRPRPGASGPFLAERLVEASGGLADVLADADAALAEDGPVLTADIEGEDSPASALGVHYRLGSRVTAGLPQAAADALGLAVPEVSDVVARVQIDHDGGAGPLRITRTVGRTDPDGATARETAALARDLLAALSRRPTS